MQSCPVNTLVLAIKPSRKRTPYIIYTSDVTGTEEVFLHKSHRVLNGTLTLRISLVAYPQLQILFCTEVFEDSCLDYFAIGFTGDKNSVLINNKN